MAQPEQVAVWSEGYDDEDGKELGGYTNWKEDE